MKTIFSLAFLATILCATVVIAAPHEEFEVEEVPFGIQEKIDEILRLYQCARGVIEEALGESGLDEDLQRFAKLFQELGEKELGKCKLEKSKLKKFTCSLSGAVKFGKLFADFTNTMVKKNVVLYEKIFKEYETKCMKKSTLF